MKVEKLNDTAIIEATHSICAAILNLSVEDKRTILESMIDNVIEPLAEDDFFGTEGWEHWAGLDD